MVLLDHLAFGSEEESPWGVSSQPATPETYQPSPERRSSEGNLSGHPGEPEEAPSTMEDEAVCTECEKNPLPTGIHKRTLLSDGHKLISCAFYSTLSKDARKQLHQNDHDTLWFSIGGRPGSLEFEEFPRFSLVLSEHHKQFALKAPSFPRLVSFTGDTGVGKSAVIQLLLEHVWDNAARRKAKAQRMPIATPVVGQRQYSVPTSADVHLYRDAMLDDTEAERPLLYADCEGFNGYIRPAENILTQNDNAKALVARFRKSGIQISSLQNLLLTSYSSVRFIRLPQGQSTPRLAEQLQKLHGMICEASEESQREKDHRKMRLSAPDMDEFFRLAFDHYSNQVREPFDFLGRIMTLHPPSDKLATSLLMLMIKTFKVLGAQDESPDIDVRFCNILAPLVCSTVVLDAARAFNTLPGSLVDIFSGEGNQSAGNAWNTAKHSYKARIGQAFDQFAHTTLQCQFVHPETNTQCVNKRWAHLCHQNSRGDRIGPGSHESELLDQLIVTWENKLGETLSNLDQNVDEVITATGSEHTIEDLYKSIPSLEMFDLVTCAWCFRNVPSEQLACGHGICSTCLAVIGGRDSSVDHRLRVVHSCGLHHPPHTFESPAEFLDLPDHVGRRILSLDGGGVRSFVGISILAAIEEGLGGEIPVRRFFDLIGGTSSGGLLAMGLGMVGWGLEEAATRLRDLLTHGFTKHSEWTVAHLLEWWITSSLYTPEAFDAAVKAAYGDLGDQRMITSRQAHGTSEMSTRVFVTATIGNEKQTTIIANYVPSGEGEEQHSSIRYVHEVISEAGRDFTVREAARATCATPSYFAPLHRRDVEYWDGGVSLNNPAPVAVSERQLIWPTKEKTNPDILLSVGNGWSPGAASGKHWCPSGKISDLHKHLRENMDSGDKWDKSLGVSGMQPKWYTRLNPEVSKALPAQDHMEALENGSIEMIASNYLREPSTKDRIAEVCRVLVATSFYFEPAQRPRQDEDGNFVIQGEILCRFPNGSDTVKGLGRAIRKLRNPRIELISPRLDRWSIDDAVISRLESHGVYRLPIEIEAPSSAMEINFALDDDSYKAEPISACPFSLDRLFERT
ncbi:PNPLA domain-containing protein [Fusarium sp. Ph1]|nr:PNPLA domain-containing protein [Fusarium sp. Ph1]